MAKALRDHGNELEAFVRARVPSADGGDVLQTAAIRAFEKAEALQDPARVLPWRYRLHRNIVTDVGSCDPVSSELPGSQVKSRGQCRGQVLPFV